MDEEKALFVVVEWEYHSAGTSMNIDSVWRDKPKAYKRARERREWEHSQERFYMDYEVVEAELFDA